jgi:hypothetical protein
VPPSGGAVNVSEGIGNPVYDEDRPLEGVRHVINSVYNIVPHSESCLILEVVSF